MMYTDDQTVIIRIPFAVETIRFGGKDRQVINLFGKGFCAAEYQDGLVFPVSNPLDDWVYYTLLNQPTPGQNVYFLLEPEGKKGNPGQDDELRSLTDTLLAL